METVSTAPELEIIVGGIDVSLGNIHYMDDSLTVLLDGNVFVRDESVHFRPTEYEILRVLTSIPGHLWGKFELAQGMWGSEPGLENSLSNHIHHIRKKLESDPKEPVMIRTVREEGYWYNPQGKIKVPANPQKDPYEPLYQDDNLEIFDTHTVKVNGDKRNLRPIEYPLLTTLASVPGKVWEKFELLDKVWGSGQGSEESLKWYIKELRKKLESDPKNPTIITTHYNKGYSFQSQGKVLINEYSPKPGPN